MFDIPAIGTEQGVERTVRDMMQDKSYGHLTVDHVPSSPPPRAPRGRLRRVRDRLLQRTRR